MKYFSLIALAALTACAAAPRAPENPNSVPSVQQSMVALRTSGTHISVTGGLFDGAAAGQQTAFVATPDDTLLCTFQTAPDPTRTGLTAEVTGHRLRVAGIYAGLAGVLLPNVSNVDTTITRNFNVQTGNGAGITTSDISQGDPRFTALMSFFAANPTPCWSFG